MQRLELLEGKFAKVDFQVSSTRTSDSEGGNHRPALIVGGYDADQHHEDTLRLVKQHLCAINVDLDLSQAFVPGLRRGFAIVPLQKNAGESETDTRTPGAVHPEGRQRSEISSRGKDVKEGSAFSLLP